MARGRGYYRTYGTYIEREISVDITSVGLASALPNYSINFSFVNVAMTTGTPQPLIKIKRQPWNHVVPLGGRFRLLCEAVSSGDEPLHYQWYFSGNPIPGENGNVFIR